jgi:CyaY protein
MTESEFTERADAALARLEGALEAAVAQGAEVDYELKDGGVLELEFENGTKIIVNRHGAAQEIWVAARAGGFHFKWDGERWVNTRTGEELFAALSEQVSAQAGESVTLS